MEMFVCEENGCGLNFSSKRHFIQHQLTSHTDDVEVYKCTHCNYTTLSDQKLKLHKSTHNNLSPDSSGNEDTALQIRRTESLHPFARNGKIRSPHTETIGKQDSEDYSDDVIVIETQVKKECADLGEKDVLAPTSGYKTKTSLQPTSTSSIPSSTSSIPSSTTMTPTSQSADPLHPCPRKCGFVSRWRIDIQEHIVECSVAQNDKESVTSPAKKTASHSKNKIPAITDTASVAKLPTPKLPKSRGIIVKIPIVTQPFTSQPTVSIPVCTAQNKDSVSRKRMAPIDSQLDSRPPKYSVNNSTNHLQSKKSAPPQYSQPTTMQTSMPQWLNGPTQPSTIPIQMRPLKKRLGHTTDIVGMKPSKRQCSTVNTAQQPRTTVFGCGHCRFQTSDQSVINDHLLNAHQIQNIKPPLPNKDYRCCHCDYETASELCMVNHLVLTHADCLFPERPDAPVRANIYSCPYCMKISTKQDMMHHVLLHYRDHLPCSDCYICQLNVPPFAKTRPNAEPLPPPLKVTVDKQSDVAIRQVLTKPFTSSVVRVPAGPPPPYHRPAHTTTTPPVQRPTIIHTIDNSSTSQNHPRAVIGSPETSSSLQILANAAATVESVSPVSSSTLSSNSIPIEDEAYIPVSVVEHSEEEMYNEKVKPHRSNMKSPKSPKSPVSPKSLKGGRFVAKRTEEERKQLFPHHYCCSICGKDVANINALRFHKFVEHSEKRAPMSKDTITPLMLEIQPKMPHKNDVNSESPNQNSRSHQNLESGKPGVELGHKEALKTTEPNKMTKRKQTTDDENSAKKVVPPLAIDSDRSSTQTNTMPASLQPLQRKDQLHTAIKDISLNGQDPTMEMETGENMAAVGSRHSSPATDTSILPTPPKDDFQVKALKSPPIKVKLFKANGNWMSENKRASPQTCSPVDEVKLMNPDKRTPPKQSCTNSEQSPPTPPCSDKINTPVESIYSTDVDSGGPSTDDQVLKVNWPLPSRSYHRRRRRKNPFIRRRRAKEQGPPSEQLAKLEILQETLHSVAYHLVDSVCVKPSIVAVTMVKEANCELVQSLNDKKTSPSSKPQPNLKTQPPPSALSAAQIKTFRDKLSAAVITKKSKRDIQSGSTITVIPNCKTHKESMSNSLSKGENEGLIAKPDEKHRRSVISPGGKQLTNHAGVNSSPEKSADCSVTITRLTDSEVTAHSQPLDENSLVVCPQCPKRLIYKLLPLHLLGHTNESKFQCKKCNFSAAKRWVLDSHIDVHSETQEMIPARVLTQTEIEAVTDQYNEENASRLYTEKNGDSLANLEKVPIARKSGRPRPRVNRPRDLTSARVILQKPDKTSAVDAEEFFSKF